MSENRFGGFPGISKATAIPNLFFATVLPELESADALLAFLWVSLVTQEQKTEARFATADQVWAQVGAKKAFARLGGGREGLERGLEECREACALLGARLNGPGGTEWLYFVNNPAQAFGYSLGFSALVVVGGVLCAFPGHIRRYLALA